MSKTPVVVAGGVLALVALTAGGIALGDHGKDDERREHWDWLSRDGGLAPVPNPVYKSECGACHMAYPPAALPGAAWAQVMGSLADHYGDDASLDADTAKEILTYLATNAADRSGRLRPRAFAAAGPTSGPLPRITETRYFLKEHHEIPARFVTGNPEVKSFSACQACHQGAEQGRFDEDGVRIPGVGRWDD